jgi:hypothetical protein
MYPIPRKPKFTSKGIFIITSIGSLGVLGWAQWRYHFDLTPIFACVIAELLGGLVIWFVFNRNEP